MDRKPSFRKDSFIDIAGNAITVQEFITLFSIFQDAFRGLKGGEPYFEISDGEVSVPAAMDDLSSQIEFLKSEKINIRYIKLAVDAAHDEDGTFKSCSALFWFDQTAIKVNLTVNAQGQSLVEIRNWGKGLWERAEKFLKNLGEGERIGAMISAGGKIGNVSETDKGVIQQQVITQHIINAASIQDSNIVQGSHNTTDVDIAAETKKNLLERISWIATAVATLIALLVYLGIRVTH